MVCFTLLSLLHWLNGTVWATVGSRLDHATDASFPQSPNNVLVARAAAVDAMIPPDKRGRTFILTCGIGTNNLGLYPGATDQAAAQAYIASYRAYCMARVAAGWTLCLFTLQPRGADSTFNARRAILNADIRQNWALYGLASAARIIDIAADPIIGTDTSQADNPSYWNSASPIHFSDQGNALVETYARAVINAIP